MLKKRKIIKIEDSKCNGCGLCVPNCPEGAIQIIDGKARIVSDLFCDGLGACIGHCPEGAITIIEREAQDYDEKKVMENIVKHGKNTIKAHLEHLKKHNQDSYLKAALDYLKMKNIDIGAEYTREKALEKKQGKTEVFHGCPGFKVMDFRDKGKARDSSPKTKNISELAQWPIQLMLVPEHAAYLKEADLLISADCVPFAYADFHQELLKGKILLVGCPKLDDTEVYEEKLNSLFKNNFIKSVTYAHMEVPCCFGLVNIIKNAIRVSGKDIPFEEVIISIKGVKLK